MKYVLFLFFSLVTFLPFTSKKPVNADSKQVKIANPIQVAFIDRGQNSMSLCFLAKDGKVRKLYSSRDALLTPRFQPNSNKILFVRYDDRTEPNIKKRMSHLFMIDVEGKGLQKLTLPRQFKSMRPFLPYFSSDGKKVTFSGVIGMPGDPNYSLRIYLLDLESPNKLRILTKTGPNANGELYQDEQKLIYSSHRNENEDIYSMLISTGEEKRLTNHIDRDMTPTCSPDGKHITWVSSRDGNSEIYIMSTIGSSLRRLTNNAGGDFTPVWTRDGRIVFSSERGKLQSLYIMNADGSNQRRLTSGIAPEMYPDCK